MKKLFVILSLLGCLLATPLRAAEASTEGTEFWLTFMSNLKWQASDNTLQLKLIVSSRYTTSVTVSNPNTSWSTSVNVAANGISEISIPVAQAYTTLTETAAKTGLRVVSSKPISLYASNYADASYDATNVLPLPALTGNYIIQTYESNLFFDDIHYAKEFVIVATDNCTVEITPHARTTTGRLRNSTFSVSLKKGEVYQVMSTDENNDLSGTVIRASRPVAVFSGHQCATVPTDNEWCDHIVEQSMPVSQWGKRFPVTASMIQETNRVLVTAVSANTEVSVNGSIVTTLGALETYEYPLSASQQSCFIETSSPAACYLYLEGGMSNNRWGDPSSVYISPMEQMIQLMTFSTFQTPRSQYHYVNIVTTADGRESIRMDGKSIRSSFTPLTGNPDLMFARIKIEHGTHTIQTDVDGCTAWVYGMGDGESYAYTACSATNALDAQIMVDGRSGAQTEMEEFCYNHIFTFTPQVNIPYSTAVWDYGDGSGKGNGSNVTHQYTKAGDYTVTMTVSNSSEEQTVTTVLHLVSTRKDTVYATICKGDTYIFNDNEYTTTGIYPVTGLLSVDGCDSIAVLKLQVNDSYFFEEEKSIAKGQTYRWRGKRYTEGVYYDYLKTESGCDSIYKLTLTEVDPPQKQYDTICYESTYVFHGHEYPIPPVDQYKDQEYVDYVLEYRDNESCLTYKLYLAIVPTAEEHKEFSVTIEAGQVYVFHGTNLTVSGDYTYEEPLGCHGTYSETLHLLVKPYPVIETEQVLCQKDDSYEFYGKTLTVGGVYFDTVYSVSGISELRKLTLVDNRSYNEINISTTEASYTYLGTTYTQTGTYTVVINNAAGCDSIITLNIGIGGKCKLETEWTDYICKDGEYVWNSSTYTSPGNYTQTFETTAHCDSVVTLHLLEAKPAATSFSASICEGDYYKWNGEKYDTEGPHVQTLTTIHGCDSVVTLNLTVNDTYYTTKDESIVLGETFKWDGDEYTEEGVYTKDYIAKNGCDSVVQINISVITTIYSEFTKEICEGGFYEWNNEKLSVQKDYVHTYLRPGKADSVVTLHLIVHPTYDKPAENVTVKESELPYLWQGVERYEEKYYTETLKTETFLCDSLVHLNLKILHTIYKTVDSTICKGSYILWNDLHCDEAKDYVAHLTTAAGCDSIVTLHLKHYDEPKDEPTEAGTCKGTPYIWHDQPYSEAGVHKLTLKNKAGCDSVYATLNLTVYEPVETTDEDGFACFGESFKWNDETYTTSGTYTQHLKTVHGCDSTVTRKITIATEPSIGTETHTIFKGTGYEWNDNTYTEEGEYKKENLTDVHGCDSTAILILHVSTKPIKDSTETATKCSGETFAWYEHTIVAKETTNSYTHRIEGEETDTIIHLSLTVNPSYPNVEVDSTICKGSYILWNDLHCDEAKDYVAHLTTAAGCDSIVTLHLKHYDDPKEESTDANTCKGTPFEWHGQLYSDAGEHKLTLKNKAGCDSVYATLNLTVYEPVETTDEDGFACFGESFKWNDETYTTSGTYTQHLKTVHGCDSTVTRKITIATEPSIGTETHTIFKGTGYEWNDNTYTEEGEYKKENLTDVHGCDSTAILILHVSTKPIKDSTETATKCSGETFAWYEHTILAQQSSTSYTHRIKGEETDTIIHLDLTVNPSYPNVEVDSTICKGSYILWNDLHCDEAKDYVAHLTTATGCDSIVTLHLKHYDDPKEESTDANTCKGTPFEWHGQQYTEAGVHKLTLKNKAGCDSVYATLNLTVYEPVETTDEDGFACFGESFKWNNETYTTSGTYTQHLKTVHGCDSTVTRKITILPEAVGHESMFVFTGGSYDWNGKTYDATGEYEFHTTTDRGCDSTAYLHLTVSDKPVYDSTDVATQCSGESFVWHGQTITPTETNSFFTARIPGEEMDTVIRLTVTVLPSYPDKEQTEYICDGDYLDWNGQRYTTDGDYRFEGHTALGCDSIVTLHLKLYPKYDLVTDEQTIYTGDSYEWEGDTYTETTTVTKTLHTVHGCDSVVTLQLMVTDHKIEYRDDYADICEGETYLFYGESLTQPTEKTVTRQGDNTDTIVTLHLSVWSDFYREITDTVPLGQSYTLGDRTFDAPGDYTITGNTVHGCDSTIVLHLTTNHVDILAIEAAEQCADDDMLEFKVDFTGVAHEVRVLFTGERAHAQGWRDTTVAMPPDGIVLLPYHGKAGRYTGSVELLFRGEVLASADLNLTLLYPSSVLEQGWNDAVLVLTHDYNGGYDFVAFEWYENGILLLGETHSYIYRPLIMGGEYRAMLTEQDGTRLMTCPLIAEPHTDITLYPTVAAPSQMIRCYTNADAELVLNDAVGHRMMVMDIPAGGKEFAAPLTEGLYLVNIRLLSSDAPRIYKLLVR